MALILTPSILQLCYWQSFKKLMGKKSSSIFNLQSMCWCRCLVSHILGDSRVFASKLVIASLTVWTPARQEGKLVFDLGQGPKCDVPLGKPIRALHLKVTVACGEDALHLYFIPQEAHIYIYLSRTRGVA